MTPNKPMAAINRLVAIGRSMKVSEKFTPGPLLSLGASAPAAALAVAHHYAAAGSEAQLPFGDHGFAGLEARLDHHVLIHARSGGDGARIHGAVFLHHVDKLPVLSRLDGFVRHYHGIALRGEPQRDAHEL